MRLAGTILFVLAPVLPMRGAKSLVMDEIHRIRAGDWSFTEVSVDRPGASIQAEFHALTKGSQVRLNLIRPADLPTFRQGKAARVLAATGFAVSGRLAYATGEPGTYAVIVEAHEGPRREPDEVRLAISIEAGRPSTPLPAHRKAIVILSSLAVFAGMLLIAGRKLGPILRSPPDPKGQ